MKIAILASILIFLMALNVFAAMNPGRAFCEHQGYTYETSKDGIYCVFNDGNKCDIYEFERDTCGKEYRKAFPCRKEGEHVFYTFEECCEGYEPYQPCNMGGQPNCRKIPNFFVKVWERIVCFLGIFL